MRRVQLFELEDLDWIPRVVRDGGTDLLDLLFARMRFYDGVAPQLVSVLEETKATRIVDLCSGGGGGTLAMRRLVRDRGITPLARPFSLLRLLITYPLPLVPVLFAWDGTVSALRAYTPDELLEIGRSVPGGDAYTWSAGVSGSALYFTGVPQRA